MTDGVKFLADNAGSYWLMDIIWSCLPKCMKDEMLKEMQFWTLEVTGTSGVVTCRRDRGNVAFKQEIPYTDFPLDKIDIWVAPAGCNSKQQLVYAAYLPSEH